MQFHIKNIFIILAFYAFSTIPVCAMNANMQKTLDAVEANIELAERIKDETEQEFKTQKESFDALGKDFSTSQEYQQLRVKIDTYRAAREVLTWEQISSGRFCPVDSERFSKYCLTRGLHYQGDMSYQGDTFSDKEEEVELQKIENNIEKTIRNHKNPRMAALIARMQHDKKQNKKQKLDKIAEANFHQAYLLEQLIFGLVTKPLSEEQFKELASNGFDKKKLSAMIRSYRIYKSNDV